MSKIIYIYSKKEFSKSIKDKMEKICKNLEPDNIKPNSPIITIKDNLLYAITNPIDTTFKIVENSILYGELFSSNNRWHKSSSKLLDGSFAIFRENNTLIEIVSDQVGSKNIWYYLDENLFIASTSQRAIIMFIESFQFNKRVIPWILSTGTLGYGLSWDRRVNKVPIDTTIKFNKDSWQITIDSNPIEFKILKKSKKEYKQLLTDSLIELFKSISLDFSKWRLPLSGGYDSRAILLFLNRFKREDIESLTTITWGVESAKSDINSDAYVAKELSDRLGINHKYYLTDTSKEPIEKIIDRFLLIGEGQIDHISGYMDGFHIWKSLYEDEVVGIIRGDEGFGWLNVSSPLHVRDVIGCALCSDYPNLKEYLDYGFEPQELPENLKQKEHESLEMWRDRLYHEYRIPTMLSALSDLKSPFVSIINPLLSRKILNIVRELPDNMRTDKTLFKDIVLSMNLNVKFASKGAIAKPKDIFSDRLFLDLMKRELSSVEAKELFNKKFLDKVLNGDVQNSSKITIKDYIRRYIKIVTPQKIKNILKRGMPLNNLNNNILIFRIYIIIKMYRVLNRDIL